MRTVDLILLIALFVIFFGPCERRTEQPKGADIYSAPELLGSRRMHNAYIADEQMGRSK